MRELLADEFASKYGHRPDLAVRSPGRVNLIGDHTDYNDGFVLPIAIDQAVWMAVRGRADREVHVTSRDHGEGRLELDGLRRSGTWLDYVAGTLREIGGVVHGFDALIISEIPAGAGLSSSAALEMAVALAASELAGTTWDPVAAATAARTAEADFVGVPCGIMDQMIVARANAGHAGLIDCRSLEMTQVPVPGEATIVIIDTGTRRQLLGSPYEERQEACSEAAAALGVPALRDVTLEQLEGLEPRLARLGRHVVTENERTLAGADALASGDLESFGRLMDASHASLRDDFEVSGPELDAVTEVARGQEGCFGARMTGGGFAGCAVALVDGDAADDFAQAVVNATDGWAKPYPTEPAAAAALL
jgi:galactokinase